MSLKTRGVKAKTDSRGKVAFHFKLPKEGLALSRILVLADCVSLVFRAANKVPTLTEQLVAAVMRLVYIDKKRPEFYYIPIPPGHPYAGRQYKQYKPEWLRGTLLGDILAEADWKMKCLHVGTRSDDAKQNFQAWSNHSNLTGLATWMDFPLDERPKGGSIIMSCDSVSVRDTESELLFVSEPKMKIEDQRSKIFTDYITHYFDSVAYHDEPLFLQMKEIVKLIVAVEWMKKRGVKVNKSWVMDCTKRRVSPAPAPVAVKPTPDQLKEILSFMEREASQARSACTESRDNNLLCPANVTVEVTDTSGTAVLTRSINDVTETRTLQVSNDRDFVYKDLNPRMPLGIDSAMRLLIPDVTSWNDLFAETVPWPHVWQGMGSVCTYTGGVTTRDIPVCCTTSSATPSSNMGREEVPIKSSASRHAVPQKVSQKDVPKPAPTLTPPTDVSVCSNKRVLNDHVASERGYGYLDGSGAGLVCDSKGSLKCQTASVPASIIRTVTQNGQTISLQTTNGSITIPSLPSPTSDASSTTSENNCAICHFEINEDKRILMCGHEFHLGCINRWLLVSDNKDCPMCREKVPPLPPY